jgi:uncharacterized cupredoxin-like copper-binding protein
VKAAADAAKLGRIQLRSHPVIATRAAILALAVAALGAATAQAQPPAPITINIVLTGGYHFEPSHIELKQGQAYILHLTNPSLNKHGLESKAFFDTVTFPDWSKGRVNARGDIEVWPGQWNDVAFTPNAPGEYDIHSPDTGDEILGMKGQIVVR